MLADPQVLKFSLVLALCSCVAYIGSNLGIMQVSSNSMENTLRDEDYIVIERVSKGRAALWWPSRQLDRGDIVVFHSPADRNEIDVKRIIGVSGDQVDIEKGATLLNGTAVLEPYVRYEPGYNPNNDYWPRAIGATHRISAEVPGNSYFVLGDNRAVSLDSRFYGPVPLRYVVGVVIFKCHLAFKSPRLRDFR
jgi:signal peptidase I